MISRVDYNSRPYSDLQISSLVFWALIMKVQRWIDCSRSLLLCVLLVAWCRVMIRILESTTLKRISLYTLYMYYSIRSNILLSHALPFIRKGYIITECISFWHNSPDQIPYDFMLVINCNLPSSICHCFREIALQSDQWPHNLVWAPIKGISFEFPIQTYHAKSFWGTVLAWS